MVGVLSCRSCTRSASESGSDGPVVHPHQLLRSGTLSATPPPLVHSKGRTTDVCITIGLNTWGLVLYNNLNALLLFPLELLIMGELGKIKRDIEDNSAWHSGVVLPVGLSCLFGLAISFFGFSCRRAISATGFTVLGIVNKFLTVVINLVIWNKHSTTVGTVGLLICMFGGVLYQQSMTKPKATVETEVVARVGDEEQQQLLEMESASEANTTEKPVG